MSAPCKKVSELSGRSGLVAVAGDSPEPSSALRKILCSIYLARSNERARCIIGGSGSRMMAEIHLTLSLGELPCRTSNLSIRCFQPPHPLLFRRGSNGDIGLPLKDRKICFLLLYYKRTQSYLDKTVFTLRASPFVSKPPSSVRTSFMEAPSTSSALSS